MALRRHDYPRDVEVLLDIVELRDARIERLETSLKAAWALLRGGRSERSRAVLEGQGDLDLGDLETSVRFEPANEDREASPASERRQRKKATRNIGYLRKHIERIEEVIEPRGMLLSGSPSSTPSRRRSAGRAPR